MTIHTVQEGDTIYSIAQQYNIPYTRLLQDNELSPSTKLNIGEALIIAYPEQTYIVQEGDTLSQIAELFGVSMIQLLRNNPQLSDRNSLIPGEELVISYNNKDKKIKVNGFSSAFINLDVLKKTLPFLTYITILNYRVNDEGKLIKINDTDVINMAKQYGVAPLMFISSLNEQGIGNYSIVHNILTNMDLQNAFIEDILSILRLKGYFGLYSGFQYIHPDDLNLYIDFISRVTLQLNTEGYEVFVSLIPSTLGFQVGVPYESSHYADIGKAVNNVTLITYQWNNASIQQFKETTPSFYKTYLDFVVTQIPPEKIFLGAARIAYEWELPYIEGETVGRFMTNSGAIDLAKQISVPISFDVETITPYYYYYSLGGVQYLVWYKDARSYDYILNLVHEYGLKGIAVWNILNFYLPFWLVINSQYDIESVLNNSL